MSNLIIPPELNREGKEFAAAAMLVIEQQCALINAQNKRIVALEALVKELLESGKRKDLLIAELTARIAELERRLGLNSSNSGKPPSTDGLQKKPRVSSLRGPSDKPTGGQVGHPGKTLCQSSMPDVTINHFPTSCGNCGKALSARLASDPVARQVFEIPKPSVVVTEHRAHSCRCGSCGTTTRAAFPSGVNGPVQYGPRAIAIARYFQIQQFVPEDRTSEIMSDVFGVGMSASTVAKFTTGCAGFFRRFTEIVGGIVAAAPVKHMDETGLRVAGKLKWLHLTSTAMLTFYRVEEKRGTMQMNVSGIIVHDHFKSYYKMTGVTHALCNQHHLRELQALVEIEKEPWAKKMQHLLRLACHAKNLARTAGVTLKPGLIELFMRRYDAILADAIVYHEAMAPLASGPKHRGRVAKRVGHNLAVRLRDFKSDVTRFLTDPRVPFTNNQAEQDVRMAKLRQKISGCFRTFQGAVDFATNRSLISTARKLGWNIIQTLMADPDFLIAEVLQI
jgi:transposase